MSDGIINLQEWLTTPPGRILLDWENEQLAASVVDVFGYHALQLGLPSLNALAANRMPHQWVAATSSAAAPQAAHLVTELEALPFAEASLDLVVMPHSLEFSTDPHQSLREAARVLVPEGHIVITGFNPMSLWGLKQWREHKLAALGLGTLYLPPSGEFIAPHRLRDWLRLLGFEVQSVRYGVYESALRSQAWLARMRWMNSLGSRYWPFFGAVYCISAIKRVRGMRLIGPSWKSPLPRGTAPVPLTSATLPSRQQPTVTHSRPK